MKLSSIISILAIASAAEAWQITFFSNSGTVHAVGKRSGGCQNLRSDYKGVTTQLSFNAETSYWPDPDGYTAYASSNCKGAAYYGVQGNQYPKKTFKSYRITG
ncbi:hypothetical protein V491_06243 [Pseudogymnoascus sp. VKM F-3775]|nr:hypothetical protein V491_06243 [Pseudogymnoascus sp. VKM F-3775]